MIEGGALGEKYLCWRITKKLENSMENCTMGDLDTCTFLGIGDICLCGERILV
jgi:hypothetical protein